MSNKLYDRLRFSLHFEFTRDTTCSTRNAHCIKYGLELHDLLWPPYSWHKLTVRLVARVPYFIRQRPHVSQIGTALLHLPCLHCDLHIHFHETKISYAIMTNWNGVKTVRSKRRKCGFEIWLLPVGARTGGCDSGFRRDVMCRVSLTNCVYNCRIHLHTVGTARHAMLHTSSAPIVHLAPYRKASTGSFRQRKVQGSNRHFRRTIPVRQWVWYPCRCSICTWLPVYKMGIAIPGSIPGAKG